MVAKCGLDPLVIWTSLLSSNKMSNIMRFEFKHARDAKVYSPALTFYSIQLPLEQDEVKRA
jgi:hypothetical protein